MKDINNYIQDKLVNTNIQERLVINSKSKAIGDDIYDNDYIYDLFYDKFKENRKISNIYNRFEDVIMAQTMHKSNNFSFIQLTEENEQKYKLDYNELIEYAIKLNNYDEYLHSCYFVMDDRDNDKFIAFKYQYGYTINEVKLLFVYNGKDDINIFIIDQK